jgi:hypothetical protein
LKTGGSIPAPRRDLQREHAQACDDADAPGGDDAYRRDRVRARGGEATVGAAQGGRELRQPRRGPARALTESASTLDEALKAPMVRQAA